MNLNFIGKHLEDIAQGTENANVINIDITTFTYVIGIIISIIVICKTWEKIEKYRIDKKTELEDKHFRKQNGILHSLNGKFDKICLELKQLRNKKC